MKSMCCCKILFHFLLFYCICDLLENRFLQKVAAKPKSDFNMSLKNESLVLGIILDTCVNKNWDNNVLLIVENTNHCTSKCLFSRNTPIHLFQSNAHFDSRRGFRETYLSNETQIAKYHKPTSCAIIITSNITDFTKLMLKMKNSIWWRHEAYFIIVNIYYLNSCQLAQEFLKQAWSFNVLSVIYICKSLNGQEEVYTFNPYAEIAPKLWTNVDPDNSTLDSSWSLLQFSLQPFATSSKRGRLACNDLFFDKSKNLHGANLKVALRNTYTHHYDSTKSGYERFTSPEFFIIANVLQHINASVTVKFSDTHGYINKLGEPQSLFKDITSGTVSIIFNVRLLRHFSNSLVHSFHAESLVMSTLKRQMTLIERLGNLSSIFFIYLFIMSLAMTGTLKYILKQPISLAALNFMRICLNNSSSTVPQNAGRRILLIMFMMIAFVFNSWVLGYLTAMASTSDKVAVIDTYGDLKKSDFVISGVHSVKDILRSKKLRDRFKAVTDVKDCCDLLFKGNRSIACITSPFLMRYFMRENELFHISKDSLLSRGVSYLIAEDFPLHSKIQSLLLRMNEGGFVKLFYDREAFYRHVRFSEKYRVKAVKLENIYYVFTILIGSWISGILILCAEVVTFKFKLVTLKLHEWYRFPYLKLIKWISTSENFPKP